MTIYFAACAHRRLCTFFNSPSMHVPRQQVRLITMSPKWTWLIELLSESCSAVNLEHHRDEPTATDAQWQAQMQNKQSNR